MKYKQLYKSSTAIVLISLPLLAATQAVADPSLKSPSASEPKTLSRDKGVTPGAITRRSASYTGYQVDGRTSASVLAAKRSHTVSKQDQNGLAIFSGIFVICLIVFFTRTFAKKK